LPPGIDARKVALVARAADGTRSPRIPAPASTKRDDTTVTFPVTALDELHLVLPFSFAGVPPALATLLQLDPMDEVTLDGAPTTAAPGDTVRGTTIQLKVAKGTSAIVEDANGTEFLADAPANAPLFLRFEASGAHHGLVASFVGGPTGEPAEASGTLTVLVTSAVVQADAVSTVTAADVHFAHLGTAFTVAGHGCPESSAKITSLEVQQGKVAATTTVDTYDVGAGSVVEACAGCANPAKPSCCNLKTCPKGCCSWSGECVTVQSADACGAHGKQCVACPSDQACNVDGACQACGGAVGAPCCAGSACAPQTDVNQQPYVPACQAQLCCIPTGYIPTSVEECCSGAVKTNNNTCL
jgi:hypothetical protein